jgi:purine-binding chemotaxis protein CheW
MEHKPYLIFNLHGLQYGLDASIVREIFPLPELTPIAEAPLDFVGILNLRSKIVPVMHLDLRLGAKQAELKLNDNVVVVEWEGLQIGIIVHSVREVLTIGLETIETDLDYGRIREINPVFINSVAKVDSEAIVLLDPFGLIRQPDALTSFVSSTDISEADTLETLETTKIVTDFYQLYCPQATPAEKTTWRRRADNLRAAIAEEIDITQQIPIAVINFNDEYFGIELESVREFTTIRNLTRIPCTSKHIVGNTNLRGEILTVIDIRSLLNLASNSVKTGSKAVVVEHQDILAALPVDEVLDVMYLGSSDINLVPLAASSNGEEYLRGTVYYQQKVLGILNLSAIFDKGGLVVNEEVA